MSEFEPQLAKREKQKALIGITGPSGSGKTVGALLLAYGMMKEAYPNLSEEELWKKIGIADTEHRRSKTYEGQVFGDVKISQFWHIDFKPPYTTVRYEQAIDALKRTGCEVIVIDSLSHHWQGEGGVVEQHGQMKGNSFQNWGKLAPESTRLVKALTLSNVHMITTLRVKTDYAMVQEDGKTKPVKVGLKPMQKDDMEFEFDTVFHVDMEHQAEISKDTSNLFDGEFLLDETVGAKLYRYLDLGIDIQAEERAKQAKLEEERKVLVKKIRELANSNVEAQQVVTQCEFKTNLSLEDFDYKFTARVAELIKEKGVDLDV